MEGGQDDEVERRTLLVPDAVVVAGDDAEAMLPGSDC